MRKESGFTLVEIMVTVTVIAVLMAIAVPMWGQWLPSYRLNRATQDLYSSFQKAKMEAVRRNVNVVLIFDVAGQKYEMYVDSDRGFDSNEAKLGSYKIPDSVTLDSTSFSANTAGFTSRGLPAKPASGFANGKVTLSNTKGITREIRLSMAGNIRINRP